MSKVNFYALFYLLLLIPWYGGLGTTEIFDLVNYPGETLLSTGDFVYLIQFLSIGILIITLTMAAFLKLRVRVPLLISFSLYLAVWAGLYLRLSLMHCGTKYMCGLDKFFAIAVFIAVLILELIITIFSLKSMKNVYLEKYGKADFQVKYSTHKNILIYGLIGLCLASAALFSIIIE